MIKTVILSNYFKSADVYNVLKGKIKGISIHYISPLFRLLVLFATITCIEIFISVFSLITNLNTNHYALHRKIRRSSSARQSISVFRNPSLWALTQRHVPQEPNPPPQRRCRKIPNVYFDQNCIFLWKIVFWNTDSKRVYSLTGRAYLKDQYSYRSFATRVSQSKIWHFWVIVIERNACG